jgi:hypothetical protein
MKKRYPLDPTPRKRRILLLGQISAGVLLSTAVHASQWTASQFSRLDPILTFETGSTALPSISGIGFTSPEIAGSSDICFGSQMLCNLSAPGGYTFLDITFDKPQQAVGGYVGNTRYGWDDVGAVTEVVFDRSNNIIESASVSVSRFSHTPVFLGIGESTTNIYKVEWRYLNAGFFGVDNVIFQPGLQMVISNASISPSNMSFSFQTLPGHTNIIQMKTNLVSGGWTSLTNMSFVGMGEIKHVSFPITNLPSAYFRVQAQ